MTTDEAAMLAAVCSAPDDDLPRLAYADWLEEHGRRDRAELIRAEVGAARQLADGRLLDARQARHLRECRERCPKPLAGLPRIPGVAWQGPTERGFVCRVEVSDAAAFLTHAGQMLAAAPVTDLTLGPSSLASLRRLADFPPAARLRRLNVSRVGAGDAGVDAAVRSPHLGRLESFTAQYCGLSDRGGMAIAAALAGRLRFLGLDGNPLTDATAAAIAAAAAGRPVYPCPPRSRLTAPYNGFPGLILFAQETAMTRTALRELDRPPAPAGAPVKGRKGKKK